MFKTCELWTVILWYELNPRVRCAFGNVYTIIYINTFGITHVCRSLFGWGFETTLFKPRGRSASVPCTWEYPKKMDGRKFWYFIFLIHPLHELHIRAKSLGEIYTHTPRRLKCIKCICYDTINFIQIRSLQEYFEELCLREIWIVRGNY